MTIAAQDGAQNLFFYVVPMVVAIVPTAMVIVRTALWMPGNPSDPFVSRYQRLNLVQLGATAPTEPSNTVGPSIIRFNHSRSRRDPGLTGLTSASNETPVGLALLELNKTPTSSGGSTSQDDKKQVDIVVNGEASPSVGWSPPVLASFALDDVEGLRRRSGTFLP